MPRFARFAPGDVVFHALNRRVDKRQIFRCDADYETLEIVLLENVQRYRMRLLGYCLMPNHWHLVLWPRQDGDMSSFMHRVTLTQTIRWQLKYEAVGNGHLYQNRYKSFPVEPDGHYLTVLRYVERNALRAALVDRAEDWRFASLWRRRRWGLDRDPLLSQGPLDLPDTWVELVNEPQTAAELAAVRESVDLGKPFGRAPWCERVQPGRSRRRPPGRPTKS